MRVLVLGATGQVGRALVAAAPAGVEALALSRADCDIACEEVVRHAIVDARPDVVFNAAAYTAVDRAEAEPEIAETINASAPRWIAAAAKEVGARNVYISTDFVFDGLSSRPYRPADRASPLGVYGRTKAAGENSTSAVDPQALIVRTAWVYAATGANFMNTMIRLMRERDSVAVVADQVGTPTYADSLAGALWALQRKGAAGVHHYTDAGVASWYDFAVAIAEEAQAAGLLETAVTVRPINTERYPTPASRPAFSVLDKTATWELLGGPAPHWRDNLRVAINELRKHG